ncbi:MAG: ATP-binding protein, partial [Planctomycetota bacterium]
MRDVNMVLRNIVKIDEEKCNGCGQCVDACAEGAIEIIDGKAKLVSEIYCDGLGACLGHCPEDAITVEQREAEQFDEEATEAHLAKMKSPQPTSECTCPGMMAKELRKEGDKDCVAGDVSSQLGQWPVQLKLLSPQAPYFANSDL